MMYEKIFFLTGKPRMGKTTLIKKIINEIGPDNCGGFYTEEIRDARDRTGFKCVTLAGESQVIANVESNSSLKIGRYGIDISNFENVALKSIQDSLKSKKVTVIDEIGFMQMLSIPFQQMIYKVVSENHHIVLGTIPLDSHPEIDKIKRLPGVKIINVNEENRDFIAEVVVKDILKAADGNESATFF
ncbi:nucleoside-triphosphatase [Paenibacillus prosopidis]|uniref:Nucleoside-triphosphatase n=1 Tax=Paenibacillus prosopidis TaxID=630520 RepID=A0A368W806_9BACL|nr:nucleoside-triphosphatase [Paenibacillus prosopidis]RCW50247.1 nucleoside-triphosphatase [Paenibacillus prosopidis]